MAHELIQDQFTEVFELLFLIKGKIGIGYRIFNDVFLGVALTERQMMNNYAMIHNKVSEFLYKPVSENIEGLALRRETFNNLIEEDFWKRALPLWSEQYVNKIQKPINEHRNEMAKKFTNRIDYVDLSAFGVGIDLSNNQNEEIVDYDMLKEKYSGTGKLYNKLESLNKVLDNFKDQLCNLSVKYDHRMEKVMGKDTKMDQFQKRLTKKLFEWEWNKIHMKNNIGYRNGTYILYIY